MAPLLFPLTFSPCPHRHLARLPGQVQNRSILQAQQRLEHLVKQCRGEGASTPKGKVVVEKALH